MADVTISSLPLGTPSGSGLIPYSDGTTTHRVAIQNLPVAYSSVTGKPTMPNNAQLAKAWVLFNGGSVSSDGSVSIYSSFNVLKVIRTQRGVYSVYLITPLTNTNYAIAGSVPNTGAFVSAGVYSSSARLQNIIEVSTGMSSSNLTDMDYTSVIVFGD